MNLFINDKSYPVIINRKKIKNAYIRVNDDLEIVVSVNKLIPLYEVNKLIDSNYIAIEKMLNKQLNKIEKNKHFYYLGDEYDIILNDSFFEVDFDNKKIYTNNLITLDKFIKKDIKNKFEERLQYNFNKMNLNIKYPVLKIRKMKTRWGVCNRKTHAITLNYELYRHTTDEIDYVIIHELVHFIYFDHSKNFWNKVGEYYPNYKIMRKKLKE